MRMFLALSIMYVFSWLDIPTTELGVFTLIILLVAFVMAGFQDLKELTKKK